MFTKHARLALLLGLIPALHAAPALAQAAEQPAGEPAMVDRHGEAGDPALVAGHGEAGKPEAAAPEGANEVEDPSRHFNFFGISPGHLFDYIGKDELGGKMGDGQMVEPETGRVIHEEEAASPPFIFMLLNFAILLGLLAWKGKPVAEKIASDRHDLIKTALDEAAKLRAQAAAKLAQYEARLKEADAEIKQLVDGMRVDAENEKARILAAAEAQATTMKREAEARISAEIEFARAMLTREVTAAAATATEKLLRDKMTAGDQQTLVGAFIADVQQAGAIGRGQGDVR